MLSKELLEAALTKTQPLKGIRQPPQKPITSAISSDAFNSMFAYQNMERYESSSL
jgi:hypothetical protein